MRANGGTPNGPVQSSKNGLPRVRGYGGTSMAVGHARYVWLPKGARTLAHDLTNGQSARLPPEGGRLRLAIRSGALRR